jgi:hypothetical protein
MNALGFHITCRFNADRVLAPDVPTRRVYARAILRVGADHDLLAFRVVDTHLHAEVACDRVGAGWFARRIEQSIQARLRPGVPFSPARIRPITDQWHLQQTFHYVLRQEQRHGIVADPLFEASNLPDLLGLRLLGAYAVPTVRALLPRVGRRDLVAYLGGLDLDATPDRLDLLSEASAAAVALPNLRGRSFAAVAARRAAVHVAAARLTRRQTAVLLDMPEATVQRLRAQRPERGMVRAIWRQLAVRAHHQ